jgi:serine/threonine protein phosphatase PrpC
MEIFSFSGKGQRKTNDDYYVNVQFKENVCLHIVADGMGGYSHGDIAAKTAVETIIEYFSSRYQEQKAEQVIQESLRAANEQIQQKQKELQTKLGTTIAGVFIRENIAYAFWLGDVQIYHFRKEVLLFLSESHSLVNEMRKNEILLHKDIERYGNIVTQSLSGSGLKTIPIIQLELHPNDVICICSDGFYREYDIDKFVYLSKKEKLELLEKGIQSAPDNYTIVLIEPLCNRTTT